MAKLLPDLWRIAVTVPESGLEAFETALGRFSDAVSMMLPDGADPGEGADWRLEAVCKSPPDHTAVEVALAVTAASLGIAVPDVEFGRITGRDWLAENLQSFPPILVGRFFVHGSHWQGEPPRHMLPLMVDAATAFGSGEHPTTQGCMLVLDRLARRRRFRTPLDMGCGSGILAMCMARMWAHPVIAADIDPEAVRVTRFNAERNGLSHRITAVGGDGYRQRVVNRRKPFDIIVANILARPLRRMAPQLKAHLAPGGVAVLSGLLVRQERLVLSAHRTQGLKLIGRVVVNGWTTLVLQG